MRSNRSLISRTISISTHTSPASTTISPCSSRIEKSVVPQLRQKPRFRPADEWTVAGSPLTLTLSMAYSARALNAAPMARVRDLAFLAVSGLSLWIETDRPTWKLFRK